MLRNFILILFRNLSRQRFYAFINVAGLTIGILTSLLIVLYIIDEFSYDRFHKDAVSIYRVNLMGRMTDQEFHSLITPAPLSAAMKKDFPGVEKTCRIAPRKDITIKSGDTRFLEKSTFLADSGFFSFFSFALIEGDPANVLSKPYNLVLTESAARRIFGYKKGTNSIIGKTLEFGPEKWVCSVSGIVQDPPRASHFQFSMLLSMQSLDQSRSTSWMANSVLTYIKLANNTVITTVNSRLSELVNKYIGPGAEAFLGVSFEDFLKNGGAYGFYLQPLKDIHFSTNPDLHLEPGGNFNTIWLLTGIAVFIIVIASINFMNLSTARYSSRAKEVGIRRSVGGSILSVRTQFLTESLTYTFLAILLAHIILAVILPQYNNLAGKVLTMVSLKNIYYLTAALFLVFFVGILAGSYPAFYLTSFRPVDVLRGTIRSGMKSKNIRRSLVIFQFTMSIILIICTLLVYKQLKYLKDKDKGFDTSNLLVIDVQSLGQEKEAFKEDLRNMPGVISSSTCEMAPPEAGGRSDIFRSKGEGQKHGSNYCFVDEDMSSTLGVSMVSGRFFSREFPSDTRAVVLNEAAARSFGWKEAVGQKIQTSWNLSETNEWDVIGVIKDYNYQSLEEEITPLLLFPGKSGSKLLVRLTPGNIKGQVDMIRERWDRFEGGGVFDYSIIADDFYARFRKEQQLGKIFIVFTILAIIVASMGLLGLSAFSAEQRSKEIGIRKTMGASPSILLKLISMEYFSLVSISFLIAAPVSYLAVNWWLKNFAYKTDVGVESFIAGGLLALLTAILSVSYTSFKAAYRNPVISLKHE